MPDEVPGLSGRTRTVVGIGVGVVVAAGLLLRFWTRSGLWLDEALTVDIARLPLHEIPNALKHDGAPPLYYYLLHFWIGLFGQSNDAVRSLSGVFAVLTLPGGWLCGKRFGGRAVAWTMLVLLASAPFAVYYATESRMYALVILLTGLGFLALQRAVDRTRPGNLIAVAVVTRRAALHPVLVALPRRHGGHLARSRPSCARAAAATPRMRRGPRSIAVGRRVSALRALGADVPLPGQAHRDAVGGAAELLRGHQRADRVHRQPGLDAADRRPTRAACSPSSTSPCWRWRCSAWASAGASSSSTCAPGPARAASASSCSGTLFAAIAGGIITSSAFSSRYAAVVFLPFLLLVALGTTTLLNPVARVIVVGLAVVAGLISSAQNVDDAAHAGERRGGRHQRPGQAGRHHRLLSRPAGPGGLPADPRPIAVRHDHVPARAPAPRSWTGSTTPTRSHAAEPGQLRGLRRRRRRGPATGSGWSGSRCTRPTASSARQIAADLINAATKNGGGGRNVVTDHPALYYEPMNLTEYAPSWQ